MKKSKLLTPILATVTLSGMIIPLATITSCSNNEDTGPVKPAEGGKSKETTDGKADYALKFEKKPDEGKATASLTNQSETNKVQFITSSNDVTTISITVGDDLKASVKVGFVTTPTESCEVKFNLNFSYKVDGAEQNAEIKDCVLKYVKPAVTAFTISNDGLVTMTKEGLKLTSDVVIPTTINGITVKGVAEEGCRKAQSTNISFETPSNITTIAPYAFSGSKITTFTLPKGVSEIGEYAFQFCYDLATFNFESSSTLKTIGELSFYSATKLSSIAIPDSVVEIQRAAFSGDSIFGLPALKSVTFGVSSQLKTIGPMAFVNAALTSIKIPDSVETLGNYDNDYNGPFAGCASLSTVEFGQNSKLKLIGHNTFDGCPITSIVLPSTLREIGSSAFRNTRITSINIPSSVLLIDEKAFNECSTLESASFENTENWYKEDGTAITIGTDEEGKKTNAEKLKNSSWYEAWGVADNGYIIDAFDRIKMLSTTKKLESSIIIPETVNENTVKGVTRDGCSGSKATSITFAKPENIVSFDYRAFGNCWNMTSFSIPNTVTQIEDGVFSGCSELTTVTFPNNIEIIKTGACSDCSKLTSVTLPANLKELENAVFSGCSSLKNIELPSTLTTISGGNTFNGCSALESIRIPSSVTFIGTNSFKDCTSLKTVYVDSQETVNLTESPRITHLYDNAEKVFVKDTLVDPVSGQYLFDNFEKQSSSTVAGYNEWHKI